MNRILMLVLALAPMIGLSQVVSNGLVGYWPMDGDATDLSPNAGVSSTAVV